MSSRLKRNYDFVKVLAKAKKRQRDAILINSDSDLVLCLCECIENILNGNIKLSSKQKKKLQRHKKALRNICDCKTKVSDKKKILVQKGGFLPLVLAPILGVAGSLLGDAISSVINKNATHD